MGYGEIWWLWEDSGPDSLDRALKALVEAGLSTENEFGEHVYLDEKGRQQPWDERLVFDLWNSGKVVTLQLWLSGEVDVVVVASRSEGVITLGLDGHDWSEARRTSQMAIGAALTLGGTRAMIIDNQLEEFGDEFNELITRGETSYPFEPALLLLPGTEERSFSITVSEDSWLSLGNGSQI